MQVNFGYISTTLEYTILQKGANFMNVNFKINLSVPNVPSVVMIWVEMEVITGGSRISWVRWGLKGKYFHIPNI